MFGFHMDSSSLSSLEDQGTNHTCVNTWTISDHITVKIFWFCYGT